MRRQWRCKVFITNKTTANVASLWNNTTTNDAKSAIFSSSSFMHSFQVTGPGLKTICIKDELEKIADFASLVVVLFQREATLAVVLLVINAFVNY